MNRSLFEKCIIYFLFFFSGAVGLVYEVLWLKDLLFRAKAHHRGKEIGENSERSRTAKGIPRGYGYAGSDSQRGMPE